MSGAGQTHGGLNLKSSIYNSQFTIAGPSEARPTKPVSSHALEEVPRVHKAQRKAISLDIVAGKRGGCKGVPREHSLLGNEGLGAYPVVVQRVIRFIGLLNAAVWLGAAVFFTLAARPAFLSAEMLSFLPRAHASRAAGVMLDHYFVLQQWCAGVALAHLLLEYVLSGRYMGGWVLGLLPAMLGVSVAGGRWLAPALHELQRVNYSALAAAAEKADAASRLTALNVGFEVVNALVILALLYYLWRLSRPANGPRFATLGQIKPNSIVDKWP
jgi:hypothetical protein